MKFGKQFAFYKIPEWSEYYLDYAAIKTVLKFIDNRKNKKKGLKKLKKLKKRLSKIDPEEIAMAVKNYYNELKENQNENQNLIKINNKKEEMIKNIEDLSEYTNNQKLNYFIEFYKSKVKIVEDFFIQKINEYQSNLENLENKIDLNKSNEKEKEQDLNDKKENAERDELGYAVSWKRALSNLYNFTSWLHSYHSINLLAIKKIQKKTKKIFKLNNIEEIDEKLIEADQTFQLFTSLDKLVDLRKKIKKLYAKAFTKGNLNKATEELDTRLRGGSRIKHTKLIFFYIGIIISSLFFFILLSFVKPEIDNSFIPFFPAYNFSFVIIEIMMGVGVNIEILRKYRINYIYIFEIDPDSRLGSAEMFQNSFLMLSCWMICLVLTKLTLCFGFFSSQYSLFSLIINCSLILFLFFPFHCMYYSFRRGVIITLIRNFFPIGKNTVRFKDFLFGDILTSLNKPFASLILSYCLISCEKCGKNNIRINECNRNTIPAFIVLFYPFVIRFTQCINRYYYTREAWPHLGNTLKYIGGLLNTIFSWLYAINKKKFFIYHIIAGIASQSYMLFWDIYVDWGLGNFKSKNFFLRNKIVYPKYMYYFAIVVDMILRFSWISNFFKWPFNLDDEWKNFILAILEAYRRIQWCVFRIENENTNNPEKYRTILAIPELPVD